MQLTIGTVPQQIQQTDANGFSLQNTGPGTLYLGNDTSVSTGTGISVLPGVTIPLTGGSILFGVSDSSAVIQMVSGVTGSTATIQEISGTVDIGEVTLAPGSEVGISGPVSIGSGNVDATITGPVTIDSGTVNVGNTPNVTPLARYDQLSAVHGFWNAGRTTPFGTGILPIASYATFVIALSGSKASQPTALDAMFQIQVTWYADAAGTTTVAQETWYWWEAASGSITVPVTAPYVDVVMAPAPSAGASVNYTEDMGVFGTSIAQERRYECVIDPTGVVTPPTGLYADANGFGCTGSGVASTAPVTHVSGGAVLNYYGTVSAGSTGVLELNYHLPQTGSGTTLSRRFFIEEQASTVASVWKGTDQLLLPEAPISLTTATGATYNVNVVHRHLQVIE